MTTQLTHEDYLAAKHEGRVRPMAARKGARLIKSRVRNPDDLRFGGYMIVDAERNFVIAGSDFTLDLEGAETWLREMPDV